MELSASKHSEQYQMVKGGGKVVIYRTIRKMDENIFFLAHVELLVRNTGKKKTWLRFFFYFFFKASLFLWVI